MGFVELLLIAVGLSADAFAVSVCKGLGMRSPDVRQGLALATAFGAFQALMPALGWALGAQFAQYITRFGHLVAFALLTFVGTKMLRDALAGDGQDERDSASLDLRELFMLSIATSIDAFAVGVSFAFLEVDIVPSALTIGVTTFSLSLCGVAIGHLFGSRWEKPATLTGGIVLLCIGMKVLLEGIGIL